MANFALTTNGKEAARWLKDKGEEGEKRFEARLVKAAATAEAAAKKHVIEKKRKRTGNNILRTISTKLERKGFKSEARIGSPSLVAKFHNEGTGLHGKRGRHYPIEPRDRPFLAWPLMTTRGRKGNTRSTGKPRAGADLSYQFATRVMHPGIKGIQWLKAGRDSLKDFDWGFK